MTHFKAFCFCSLSILSFILPQFYTKAHANEVTSIELYLPIEQSDFPNLAQELSNTLSNLLDLTVVVQTREVWQQYQQSLREGNFHIAFTAPHFAAWNINNKNAIPLLKLHKPLQYLLLVKRQDVEIFEVSDLANKPVCTQQPINLDYLLLQTQFADTISAPTISFETSPYDALKQTKPKCRGFMIVKNIFEKWSELKREHWTTLYQGPDYNNYAWLVTSTLPTKTQSALTTFLQSEQGMALLSPLYENTCYKCYLIPSVKEDYPKKDAKLFDKHWR